MAMATAIAQAEANRDMNAVGAIIMDVVIESVSILS